MTSSQPPEDTATDQPEGPLDAPSSISPWGPWATVGWTLFTQVASSAAVMLGLVVVVGVGARDASTEEVQRRLEEYVQSGQFLSLSVWIQTAVTVPLVLLLANVRRGATSRPYLGLEPVTLGSVARWVLASTAFVVASDLLGQLLDRPLVWEGFREMYVSAEPKWLLWSALVIAAPLMEELLFRGFMLPGLVRSRLGEWGAVIVASLAWTALHLQYGAFELGIVFLGGLILGFARLRTGSVVTPLAMHFVWNLIATVQAEWVLGS